MNYSTYPLIYQQQEKDYDKKNQGMVQYSIGKASGKNGFGGDFAV